MKKIRLWKVIVLSMVTFGVYPIVWAAQQRNELVRSGQKLPHWLWLVIPPACAITLGTGLFVVLSILLITTGDMAFLLPTLITPIVLFLIPYAISVWWVYRYSTVVAPLIDNKVPVALAVLLYLFMGFVLVWIYQFYFNRRSAAKPASKKKPTGPSRKFIVLSVVFLIFAGFSVVYSISTIPAEYEEAQRTVGQEIKNFSASNDLLKEADTLQQEYNACTDKLNRDFQGVITPDQELAYNSAYETCEAIRIKQNEAIDAYNRTW